jgi:signal transduction histidine kinase
MSRSADLEQRVAYLDLTPADLNRLTDLRPILEERGTRLVDAFYRHLLSFPQTRALIRDPGVRQRLMEKQHEYLLSLAGPTIDEDYLQNRRRIGETHERIGLEPRWYLGAYALYLSILIPAVHESMADDSERAGATIASLQKLLFLDAQIAMESYIDRQQQQLNDLTSELTDEGRRLARDFEDQRAELRTTEDRARAAEELASVATLVAGLAHEIGTPMGVIQGHAALLESAVTGDDAIWRLRTIREQISRISKIIKTLLNMARPGKIQRVPVALDPLIETTLAFIQEKLARNRVELKVTGSTGPDSVLGDPERLQQLFLNLFLNAVDAMPDGGELRVELGTSGDGDIEVQVADNGTGINERDLPRIFEPFFTTKEAGSGNGLGLVVAKGIVTDHGGDISVTSEQEKGTSFRISFPSHGAAGSAIA